MVPHFLLFISKKVPGAAYEEKPMAVLLNFVCMLENLPNLINLESVKLYMLENFQNPCMLDKITENPGWNFEK